MTQRSTALRSARIIRLVATGYLLDIVGMAGQHAAVVLRPGAVDRGGEDGMADLPGAEVLRFGRRGKKRIDFSFDEKILRSTFPHW